MRSKKKRAPGTLRLMLAVAMALCALLVMMLVMPHHFPYDRLEHLYAIEGYETIPVGHEGGEFVLMTAPINGFPEVEVVVNGKVYGAAECMDKEHYRVTLGAELFEAPGVIQISLREKFFLPFWLRSNTIGVPVVE